MDILLICRNNEIYFNTLFPKILNELKDFDYRLFIYENNSIDNTKNILKKISSIHKNIFIKIENSVIVSNRYINICKARNKMLDFYKLHVNDKYKNVIMLDTNIFFTKNTILSLFKYKDLIKEGVIFLPFTRYLINNNYNEKDKQQYYYDLLALNYGDYFMSINSDKLTFDELKFRLVNKYKKIENGKVSYDNKIISNNVLEIESGSGGFMLLDRDLLLRYGWHLVKSKRIRNNKILPNTICEHWDLCTNFKNHGKIILIRDAKAIWYRDKEL